MEGLVIGIGVASPPTAGATIASFLSGELGISPISVSLAINASSILSWSERIFSCIIRRASRLFAKGSFQSTVGLVAIAMLVGGRLPAAEEAAGRGC